MRAAYITDSDAQLSFRPNGLNHSNTHLIVSRTHVVKLDYNCQYLCYDIDISDLRTTFSPIANTLVPNWTNRFYHANKKLKLH